MAAEYPSLDVNIFGVNENGQDHANNRITDGRDLPWLQDVDADQNGASDVWSDLWKINYRDVVVLDPTGELFGVYNLTEHDLADPANYDTMKQMLIDAAASNNVNPWQNPNDPMDVNNDGALSPIDALQIINYLISEGSKELPATKDRDSYLDTTGDGFVSPRDALLVINRLNEQSQAAAARPDLDDVSNRDQADPLPAHFVDEAFAAISDDENLHRRRI